MSKDKLMPFSILCLSISIIISASIISKGMKSNGEDVSSGLTNISSGINSIANVANVVNNNKVVTSRNTYDLNTAAYYLGIAEGTLRDIVSAPNSGIPYVKVGEQYIFSKSALDKWLETVRFEIK